MVLRVLHTLGLAPHILCVSITPHDSYLSSIGVLGCKIDTDRVAYWPGAIDCDNLCVQLSFEGRAMTLLRVDSSGGAYDISYNAWNYLVTGQSASISPVVGGGVEMQSEVVDMSCCADILDDGRLPLSAPTSMNFLGACVSQPSSWVGQNYQMYNIYTSTCTLGVDEYCTVDLAISNPPDCPSRCGNRSFLSSQPVWNMQYGTGEYVKAV